MAVLLFSAVSLAQVQLGNFQATGMGTLIGGYNSSYGDLVQSNHSFFYGGTGNFNGFYYDPRFLSFHARPFYNQSRANSAADSIFDSSGIDLSSEIFGGSRFPGSVGFSDFSNKRSMFGQANGPELTTNGNGHGYNLSWSALLPDYPTFTVTYMNSTGGGKVLGTNQESSNDNQTLSFRSNYRIAGFQLKGDYQKMHLDSHTPGFLVGTSEIDSSGKNDLLDFQVTHSFPLRGTVYTNVSKMHFENFTDGESLGKSTVDTVMGGISIIPTTKLSMNFNGSYTDSLYGVLNQSFAQNTIIPTTLLGGNTRAYSVSAGASYAILNGLYAAANMTHVGQEYFGQNHQNTFFTGTLYGAYRKPLWGVLNWSVSVINNTNQNADNNLGFNGSLSASKRFGHWETGADFNYQQNVATMLVGYTESSYRWGSHVNRRADRWYWSAGVGGAHSLLTTIDGNGNHSENVFTTVGNGRYSINGNFSKAAGTSVLTSNGLQSVPIVPIITPERALILFNATSWGFTATATPRRSLTLWTNYSKAKSDTINPAVRSNNATGMFSANVQYHARRLTFDAGFERFSQTIGILGTSPANVNSYFVGVSRWFGFF